MYRVLNNEPQSAYLTCTQKLPHTVPTLGTINLVCQGYIYIYIYIFKTSVSFSGAFLNSVEQPTSDSQILSVTQLLQEKTLCTP